MLVSSFNLSQSFNYAPYLFFKKWFKSEINCFCILTLIADKTTNVPLWIEWRERGFKGTQA
jgi:hypothetical protein